MADSIYNDWFLCDSGDEGKRRKRNRTKEKLRRNFKPVKRTEKKGE